VRSSQLDCIRGGAAGLAAAILLGASSLSAQGRSHGGSQGDPSAPSRPSKPPVLWEPEQIFPLAVARAGELHLTDDQRARIETLGSELRAKNAPLLDAIDTLRPPPLAIGDASATAPTPPPPTPEEIAAVVARRHALGDARAQLHDNTRLARDSLMAVLTPEQQTKLEAAEESARSAAERGDPGESGEGRGGGHHGGGRGRPPA
jgi:Spy/CpxP family protein refolding chaperone